MIQVKRAYEPLSSGDGKRFLVERLWPRAVRKDELLIDAWLKDVAPSTELRQWFSHDPAKWMEFRRRYFRELDANPMVWRPILEVASGRRAVTLIYSARDTEHNNAVVLCEYLEKKLRTHSGRTRKAA